jgi:hypothetical protein
VSPELIEIEAKSLNLGSNIKISLHKKEPFIGPVWIHGLELVLASWSSTSHKVSKHEG